MYIIHPSTGRWWKLFQGLTTKVDLKSIDYLFIFILNFRDKENPRNILRVGGNYFSSIKVYSPILRHFLLRELTVTGELEGEEECIEQMKDWLKNQGRVIFQISSFQY